MKLTRRQLLLAGLTSGVATVGTQNHLKLQKQQELEQALEKQATKKLLQDYTQRQQEAQKNIDTWFRTDEQRLLQGLTATPESAKLTPPKIPYNREVSKILIQCCRISTEQYTLGKLNPQYDGTIKSLPTYSSRLSSYKQIAVIQGQEDDTAVVDVEVLVDPSTGKPIPVEQIQPTLAKQSDPKQADNNGTEVPVNPLIGGTDPTEKNLQEAEEKLDQAIKQVVKLSQKLPVYYGYVLTSKTSQIIVFRGTTRPTEWFQNILAVQQIYENPTYGKVHLGFFDLYKTLALQVRGIVANGLNPSLPLYIAGHSLGGALATLAALDLALNLPQFKDRIQLYTYASPRVGDPDFATHHSQLLPNSYRVTNLADTFPLLPPIATPAQKLLRLEAQTFSHLGQEWSFLANLNDMDPNHRIDTYRSAILRGLETDRTRAYPVSGLS